MFATPQSALPLPARPSLERYRKLAKDLHRICKACKPGHPDDLRTWAEQWVDTLIRLSGVVLTPQQPARRQDWIDGVESFARQTLLGNEGQCSLAHAQFVIARSHGFASWARFADYLRARMQAHSVQAQFEAAVDAVVGGDATLLRQLLTAQPALVRTRSMREHRATLLHYVAANGVENYRQKTPPNAVEIAGILLQAGAAVDATAHAYGGEATTLGLAATSGHPERAGVVEDLLSMLLDNGAAIEPDASRSIVSVCLANGRLQAASFLVARGARCGFIEAAALGDLDAVRRCFSPAGMEQASFEHAEVEQQGIEQHAIDRPTPFEIEQAFLYASQYGQREVAAFLIAQGVDLAARTRDGQTALHEAVIGCSMATVSLLLDHNPPLEAANGYGGTPAGQALWSAAHSADPDRYIPILDALVNAGAHLPERHAAISPGIDAWLAHRGSHIEPEWRW